MCRDRAHGGRRCSRANRTRFWRTRITERLARNVRVAGQFPDRAEGLEPLIQRDRQELSRINEAVSRYGECVSDHHIPLPESVENLTRAFLREGMIPLLVGGSVRDSLIDGRTPKDLDFEVYGASTEAVAALARKMGKAGEVGQAFGVVKLVLPDGQDVDLSVPRRDNKVGTGHRGFRVDLDPTMTVAEAAARRDFTINALSYDPRLGVVIDPHGGRADLEAGVLRHVSPAFAEDPLRVLRAMQFGGRYGMGLHPDTATLCARLRSESGTIAVERVRGEWTKWADKSIRPSVGLDVLHETTWDRDVTGLAEANTLPVREAVDRSVGVAQDWSVSRTYLLPAVVARALSDGDARAFLNQSVEGSAPQRRALHMSRSAPLPTDEAQAREQALDTRCTLRERLAVAESFQDAGARQAYEMASRAGVLDGPERDILDGREILAASGRKAGPWMADLINQARHAQARGDFRDHDGATEWLRAALHTEQHPVGAAH